MLVVAHDLSNPSESVTWLKAQPLTSVVMQQGQRRLPRAGFADQGHWLASNIGGPAASYLQFILEHYDDLPPVMIFTEASDDYVAVVIGCFGSFVSVVELLCSLCARVLCFLFMCVYLFSGMHPYLSVRA